MFLRKIKDIQISNKKISVIRDADITVKDIEDQIKQIEYTPADGPKGLDTENAKVPPFIQVFYYLFFSYLKIPSENDFWATYSTWVGTEDENGALVIDRIKYKTVGLRNRLNRTYPSLIRDLHFLYLLDESKKFELVQYSMHRDYFNGLDLKIVHLNKDFYISLFIDTSRGRYFKKKKIYRHDYSNINEIEFNVNFNTLTKLGDIYVLNKTHIQLLEDIINEK